MAPRGRPKKLGVVEPVYTAKVNVLGKKYEATGPSILEALSKLNPKNCKGKAILSIGRNGVFKDRVLMPIITYRLFNSHGLTREVMLKNVSNMFAGI